MKRDLLQKILSEHKELSSLPQVITEIIKVTGDSNSSASDLSKVIMKDPNLTTRLLRVVNSPYYSPIQPITTINQAVITMGLRAVTAMALAASIYNLVHSVNTTVDRKRFWRHSLEVAMASQEIARAINYVSPEEAFICGLLHDIGIIILEASYPEEITKIWKLAETGESIVDLEEEYWGTNHARIGQFLLRQWGLPEVLSEAIGGHHMEFGPEDNHPYQRIILIVNLANRISRFKVGNIPPPDTRQIEIKKVLTGDIGLSESTLAEIERSLISEIVAESGFLEIEIGSIEDILKEANQILYEQYLTVEKLHLENRELKDMKPGYQSIDSSVEIRQKIMSVFGESLYDVGVIIRNRALILKAAASKGDIKDKNGIVTKLVDTITESTDTSALILDELKRFCEANSPKNIQLEDFKRKMVEHLKILDEFEIAEPV